MSLDEWKAAATRLREHLVRRMRGQVAPERKENQAPPPPLTWQEWPERLRGFPARYQRAFLDLPLTDPEQMIARTALAEKIEPVVAEWLAGGAQQIALVGEPGAGKSTFLNWLHKHVGGKAPVVRLRFADRPDTPATLLRELASAFSLPPEAALCENALIEALCEGERRVILLDDAGRIALRVPKRSAVARCFLHIVLHTRGRVLWVAAFRNHMWQRLVYQHEIDAVFSSVHAVKFFTRNELSAALVQRMGRSGLPVVPTDPEDEAVAKLAATKAKGAPVDEMALEEARDTLAKKREGKWFESAHDYSDGQFPLALYYWAQRAEFDADGERVSITEEPRKLPEPRLPKGVPERLALAELMVHGDLTSAEHSAIFQWSEPESRLLLERLVSAGWLVREGEVGTPWYYVSPLRHQKLGKLLESTHMLY